MAYERPKPYRQYKKKRKEGLDLRQKLMVLGVGFALAVMCLGGILFFIYKGLGQSVFFQITAIHIQGCRSTTKDKVLDLSGIDIYSNLLTLDKKKVKENIEAHDWIEHAEIKKDWPSQLEITVRERIPVALAAINGEMFYLDRKGVAFVRIQPPDDMDYPVISGLSEDALAVNENRALLQDALSFLRLAAKGESILPKQNISEIHLTEDGEIILFLVSRPFPIYLGRGNISRKYYRLAKVLYWLYKKKEFDETAYIRMHYMEDKVLIGKAESG